MEDPKRLVQSGYDGLRSAYRLHHEALDPARYVPWLEDLAARLPTAGRVLELGCGDGIPAARFLSPRFEYLGVDLSPVQIELARQQVPDAAFEVGDMTRLRFDENSFDAVLALYSIIHVPLDEQPALFDSIFRWLKPGGLFLAVLGAETWTGTETDWIQPGTSMYWSHTDPATYRVWLETAGFSLLENVHIPEGNGAHTFFLAKKNG